MMIRLPIIAGAAAAAVVAVAVAGAVVLLGGDGGESAVNEPSITPRASPAGSGGLGGRLYPDPLEVVPGRYVSPAGSPDAQERGLAALSASRGEPQFEGVINGIRLWSDEHAGRDGSVKRRVCGGEDYVEWREVDALVFDYLPPGTAAFGPQTEAICPDGSVGWVGLNFVAFNAVFDIYYQPEERAFGHDAAVDRIEPATVQGRPAVIVQPLTAEGFGSSQVAVSTDRGMISVVARDLPLDEALKIAEGVRCADCY